MPSLTTLSGNLRIRAGNLVLSGLQGPCCCDEEACAEPTYFGLEYPDTYGWRNLLVPGPANRTTPQIAINPVAGEYIARWQFQHEPSKVCEPPGPTGPTGPSGPSSGDCGGWNCDPQGGTLICRFYVGLVSTIQVTLKATAPESARSGYDTSKLKLRNYGGGSSDILEDSYKNCDGLELNQQNHGSEFKFEFASTAADPPATSCESFAGDDETLCAILTVKPGWYEYEFNTDTIDGKWHDTLCHDFDIQYLESVDPENLSEWIKGQWNLFPGA